MLKNQVLYSQKLNEYSSIYFCLPARLRTKFVVLIWGVCESLAIEVILAYFAGFS